MFQSIPFLLMALFTTAAGVAPTIDLSHNMRILKLPMDTKPGSIIYRLRGSDPDNDVLTFGVRGDVGNQLLNIQSVTETRANVLLKTAPTEKEYKLTIYVTDGTQTTEVESTIIITNATNLKSPFLEYDPLISVSELTEEKDVIGSVVVRKRNSSSLPVLFELEGSDKFAIRYLISPLKEASKAEIFLLQKLDYEKKNLYTLVIYALVRNSQ
ncbi:UNVERIFIED_CONTAM: Cad86C [Trichonephila clavipes]